MILSGLLLGLSGLQPASAKEKIPEGLKTKTEIIYNFVEEFGEYKKGSDKQTIYRYDDKGNLVEKVEYDHHTINKTLCKYDDQGNLIEESEYSHGKLRRKWLWKYDDKSNLVEKSRYDADDGKLEYLSKYDDKGNETEVVRYDPWGKFESKSLYKYDDKGNKIEYAYYLPSGKLEIKETCKYDNKGNPIEWAKYDAYWFRRSKVCLIEKEGGEHNAANWAKGLCKYKYNKDNLIEWANYARGGEFGFSSGSAGFGLLSKVTYKYDNKGNRIEGAMYDGDGMLTSKFTARYDDKGNQIEGTWWKNPHSKLTYSELVRPRVYEEIFDRHEEIAADCYDFSYMLWSKVLYKYDDKGNRTEQSVYQIDAKFGKVQEVPILQTAWEYEFY